MVCNVTIKKKKKSVTSHVYVKIMPTDDLSYSPTLPPLILRPSVSVTATKMTNIEILMGHHKNHFICFSLNYSRIILSASFSTSQDVEKACFYWDYFVLINGREAEAAQIILFGARSNSAQHHMLRKQSSSLFLVPLGQQLIGSHLKKPRYSPVHHSHHPSTITNKKTTYMA